MLDYETTLLRANERPSTKLIGLYDGDKYRMFFETEKLLKYLEQCEPLLLFHHTDFDVIQMLSDGADLNIVKSHNGKIIECRLGEHLLVNSYRLIPASLAAIFKVFGYEKTGLIDLQKRNYDDCVKGHECFLRIGEAFKKVSGVDLLEKSTIASASLAAAESFAQQKLPKDSRFLNAFRGGRVEVFKAASQEFYLAHAQFESTDNQGAIKQLYNRHAKSRSLYDINSSYPASFLEMPARDKLLRLQVMCRDWHAPFFHEHSQEKLLFPNGKFTTWIYQSNLDRHILPILSHTKIKVIERHSIDFDWARRLCPLIQQVFLLKKSNSDNALGFAGKIFLNSIYGKIGLRPLREMAYIGDKIPLGSQVPFYSLPNGRLLIFKQTSGRLNANYPLAAFVTDNARARLYNAIKLHNADYGDTDSVFVDGDFTLPVGNDLGEWKFVEKNSLLVFNVKDYRFGERVVRKGGTKHLLWTLKQFASGKPVREVSRERRTTLAKRVLLADGTTRPIVIGVEK